MNILCAALSLIAKCTIIMACHIRHQDDVHLQKRYHYRIGTYIIRTKWGNRIKRKYMYICICKRNSEIVSASVIIQNDLILFFSAFK